MGMLFLYSIKSGICLIAFYLFYKMGLSRETFHAFNRKSILLMILMALIVPLIQVELNKETPMTAVTVDFTEMLATVQQPLDYPTKEPITMIQLLFLLYIIGVGIFAVVFLLSLWKLRFILRSGTRTDNAHGEHLVVIDRDIAPFSWFNYIVVARKDYQDHPMEILTHERAHIAHHHSVDILLCNIMLIFQWYNPAAWLLRRELQEVHEYEADEAVLAEGVDARNYQLLLVMKAVGEDRFALANNFNHNSLKKRITMMKMQKSNGWKRAKLLLALPLTAIAVVAFANESVESMAEKIVTESNNAAVAVENNLPVQQNNKPVKKEKAPKKESKKKVYDIVEQMPSFPGGPKALYEYIGSNVKYPAEATATNKSGRVIVAFVVDKNGNIIEPTIIRSVCEPLDKEALRVIKEMPKWTPGKQNGKAVDVKYVIPVSFNIGTITPKPNSAANKEENKQPNTTLYIVDGKRIDNINTLKPDQISSLQIFKDAENIKKYSGDENTENVIVVTTKKNENLN